MSPDAMPRPRLRERRRSRPASAPRARPRRCAFARCFPLPNDSRFEDCGLPPNQASGVLRGSFHPKLSFGITFAGRRQYAEAPDAVTLRTRRERPRHRAPEKGDELAPFELSGLHPVPASQRCRIAGYRIRKDPSIRSYLRGVVRFFLSSVSMTMTASSFAGAVVLALRLTRWMEPGVSCQLSPAR